MGFHRYDSTARVAVLREQLKREVEIVEHLRALLLDAAAPDPHRPRRIPGDWRGLTEDGLRDAIAKGVARMRDLRGRIAAHAGIDDWGEDTGEVLR